MNQPECSMPILCAINDHPVCIRKDGGIAVRCGERNNSRREPGNQRLVAMVLHVAADDSAIEDVESCE